MKTGRPRRSTRRRLVISSSHNFKEEDFEEMSRRISDESFDTLELNGFSAIQPDSYDASDKLMDHDGYEIGEWASLLDDV